MKTVATDGPRIGLSDWLGSTNGIRGEVRAYSSLGNHPIVHRRGVAHLSECLSTHETILKETFESRDLFLSKQGL